MNISDRMVNYIQAKADIEGIIRSMFPDYVTDGLVVCPFHEEKKASLHISPDGKAKCHGCCTFYATNIVDLYGKVHDIGYHEARRVLYDMVVKAIPKSKVRAFMAYLNSKRGAEPKHARKYIEDVRRLDMRVAQDFGMGLDPHTHRLTLPVYDQFGSCVNIRLLAWSKKSDCKVINTKDHGEVRLYPEWLIVKEDRVVLVEGEFDMLIGRQYGLPTCTWTAGASNWGNNWTWILKDKIVFILYDNDEAGRKGTDEAVEKLKGVSRCTIVLDPLMKEGKDLNDWARLDHTKVQFLASDVEAYKAPEIVHKNICPHCGQEMPKGE